MLKKRVKCPYCRSCLFDVIGQIYLPNFFPCAAGRVKLENGLSDEIKLLKCQSCGLLYKNLILSKNELRQMFDKENCRQAVWEYEPDNKHILRQIQIMKEISRRGKEHVLDIGCHTGLFLRSAQEAGFKTSGLDFSDRAYAEHGRFVNAHYYMGFIEEVQLPANSFDIVTAWDVFEHFYDVRVALQKIHYSLRQGGYLLIETGNVCSFPAMLRGPNNYWYVSILEHFNFFQASSIRYILNDMNFRIKTIDKTYHKSIDKMSAVQVSKSLLKSLVFYISPEFYRCLSKLNGTSGEAARLPWKDHIFVIAQKQ
jgi:2-polyprenyl-3-methyl-5-hydroxy-6-metoxy-1,4-benzoquinol methylase